nr:ankyrin repeat domain-containing protein 50-like isoform X2 [Solanum lycopersicum]
MEMEYEIVCFDSFFHLPAPLTEAQKQVLAFLESACAGDVELFKKLAKGLDHDGKGLAATVAGVKDAQKRGSLHFAAGEGKIDLCKYLVDDLKMDVNERDKEGETPVLNAARHGHTATVQYLIDKGAEPAILSTSGAALHNAARNGHIELVKFFLSIGVDIDLQSDVGTPLMWAVGHRQKDVVKVLLANFNQVGDDGMSPLQAAVAVDSFPCVELLVKAGANVNVMTGEGMWCGEMTPLLVAARKGNAESVKCLLQAGADPNFTDQDGYKPIHYAARSDSRECVEALLTVTSDTWGVCEWTVDGVIEFMKSEQGLTEAGRQANKRPKKDLPEAISYDPTDGTLFSGRSDCWFHLGQGESALTDAKACKRLGQDLAKAYYREGAALRL